MTAATTKLGRAPEAPMSLVEWRPQGKATNTSNGWRCQWVAYLDAAAVAGLLDEWVGPANWRDTYEPVRDEAGKANAMWCFLEVRDPATGEWVGKHDVGVPSSMEAAKGLVSDAFKRAACLKWGAGRNVYDLPGNLWASCDVYGKENHPKAGPNTLKELLAECRKRGVDIEATRVADTESASDEPAPAAPPVTASPEPENGEHKPILAAQKKAIAKLCEQHGRDVPPLDDLTYADAVALLGELQKAKAA